MLRRAVLLLPLLLPAVTPARAEETPAGYIVAATLADPDKTPVKRGGEWLRVRLLMPLYEGDFVKLNAAASTITIESGDGRDITLAGGGKLYPVTGRIATGDDAGSIITAIGTALGGDEQTAAENMAAREGRAIEVAIARRGTNLIADGTDRVWLAWSGGTGPFKVTVKTASGTHELSVGEAREVQVPLTLKTGERALIEIGDAAAGRARVDLRGGVQPSLPGRLASARGDTVSLLVTAAWLAQQDKGGWRLQAAQLLHARAGQQPAAAQLLGKLEQGWTP